MTEPTEPPFDPSQLSAEDTTLPGHTVPDHEASRGAAVPPIPESPRRGIRNGRAKRTNRSRSVPEDTPTVEPFDLNLRSKGQFVKPITQFYTTLGTVLMPFDAVCGSAFILNAEQCAKSMDDLAYENEAVNRALRAFIKTSVWGTVFVAHAPILLAIGMHHVPPVQTAMGKMGENFAEQVAAQMRAQSGEA